MNSHDERGCEPVRDELSDGELAEQAALALPDRELMSTIRLHPGVGHIAAPINEALALNHESTDSVAFADAEQTVVMGPLDASQDPNSTDGG